MSQPSKHQAARHLKESRRDQLQALTTQPIRTEPNTTDYEWAGATLQRMLQTPKPVAETWPFFSGSSKPARIEGTAANGTITMADLVTTCPEVLGSQGIDADHARQKYFFVKFLDPSDFPPFAYVGFNPDAAARLRTRLERIRTKPFSSDAEWSQGFREHIAHLLWQDRRAVEAFATMVQPRVVSATIFQHLKDAYKSWAIAQATVDWKQKARIDLTAFVDSPHLTEAIKLLERQQAIRRELAELIHRIDFTENQAILIESPTLHAIAGLSLQIHPRARGNFHPKDELWIYKPITSAKGEQFGWVLVEPQRTFDKTESGADFFTPFAWRDGRLGFRKTITQSYLTKFVALMDATPRPRAHYVRTARPMDAAQGSTKGAARWIRLVEESSWPYFLARELRFAGPGESLTPLSHACFIELHATMGEIEVTLRGADSSSCTFTVTPSQPVFLPASLPYQTIRYRAQGPAQLQLFTRHNPSTSA